jgi:hypothetical protein
VRELVLPLSLKIHFPRIFSSPVIPAVKDTD